MESENEFLKLKKSEIVFKTTKLYGIKAFGTKLSFCLANAIENGDFFI